MPAHFSLLPRARSALSVSAGNPEAGNHRRQVAFDMEVRAGTARATGTSPVSHDKQVLGAGDITSIKSGAICAIDPPRGARAFEPNYFPYVEFVDADFPWRYSLDTRTGSRTTPWVALIALRNDEFEYLERGMGPLPRIRVHDATRSLPRTDQLWAAAHVHVDRRTDATSSIASLIDKFPSRQLSRLLCLRKLQERERYTMFLVPSFEAGRLRGLGSGDPADPWDAPAWGAQTTTLDLPVYMQTSFTTSSMEDFEFLARRLRGQPADEIDGFGESRAASAARPGYYADYEAPGEEFAVQAALHRPGARLPPHDTEEELETRLAATLTEVIEGESVTSDGPEFEDPLFAMPAYGWRFRQEKEVDPGRVAHKQWFHRLNLDLKLRQVAGRGAHVVDSQREALMAAAWDQYDEIVEANGNLARLSVAKELVGRLATKRIDPLPSSIQLSLQTPLHAAMQLNDDSLLDAMITRGIPSGYLSINMRKVAAKRTLSLEDRRHDAVRHVPVPAIPGDLTADTRFEPQRASARPATPIALPRANEMPEIIDRASWAPATVRSMAIAVKPFRSETVCVSSLASVRRLPEVKARHVVQGLTIREQEKVAPILRAPRIPRSLVDDLLPRDKDALVAGLDRLPDNTVTLLEENRAFVESFLVGANHTMNNELRWREFPTDMRGTVLPRFWNRGFPGSDPKGDDIPGIHTWTDRIGGNFPDHDDGQSDLVLVIRGDIIRKVGHIHVVLNRATSNTWKNGEGTDHQPVFSGTIGDDVAYYGFNVARANVEANLSRYFFVLYEPMGRLRFGLDVGTARVRRERFSMQAASLPFELQASSTPRALQLMPTRFHQRIPAAADAAPSKWDDLSWSHVRVDPAQYLDVEGTEVSVSVGADYWSSDRTSASIARSTWQKPVAAVVPARRIL